MAGIPSSSDQTLETGHEDMVHDAVLDYYGKRLATCSSDKTIKIFAIEGDSQRSMDTLRGHEGPVWQVSWAHPKFGTILASASYDARVIVWRDSSTSPNQSQWSKLFEHTLHTSSVNGIAWAPHELGALLACASSDGKVSILEFKDDGTWDTKVFNAHGMGVNAVSWAPSVIPGSLVSTQAHFTGNVKKLTTGGCDNLVKIWVFEYSTFGEAKLIG
jgi:protein transport protein SEC13